jgi:hypothetical protein
MNHCIRETKLSKSQKEERLATKVPQEHIKLQHDVAYLLQLDVVKGENDIFLLSRNLCWDMIADRINSNEQCRMMCQWCSALVTQVTLQNPFKISM